MGTLWHVGCARARPLLLAVALAGGLAAPGAADAPRAPLEAIAFEGFLARSVPLCEREAAPRCVEAAWHYADKDNDRRLSVGELEGVRHNLKSWLAWKDPRLTAQERQNVLLGLMVVEALGLAKLVDTYDRDGDGAVSQEELLADVRLDQRPLAEVLRDPEAVNWDRIGRRLGPLAPALTGLPKLQ